MFINVLETCFNHFNWCDIPIWNKFVRKALFSLWNVLFPYKGIALWRGVPRCLEHFFHMHFLAHFGNVKNSDNNWANMSPRLTCWLKGSQGTPQDDPACVSGPVTCASESCCAQVWEDTTINKSHGMLTLKTEQDICREGIPEKTPFLLSILQINPPPPQTPFGQLFHFVATKKRCFFCVV